MLMSWQALSDADTDRHGDLEEDGDHDGLAPAVVSPPEAANRAVAGTVSATPSPGNPISAPPAVSAPHAATTTNPAPASTPRRPLRPERESPLEELARLLGTAAERTQAGALESSNAVLKVAADTAAVRLRESEQLAKRLIADAQDSIKRREAAIEAESAALKERERKVREAEADLVQRERTHQTKVLTETAEVLKLRQHTEDKVRAEFAAARKQIDDDLEGHAALLQKEKAEHRSNLAQEIKEARAQLRKELTDSYSALDSDLKARRDAADADLKARYERGEQELEKLRKRMDAELAAHDKRLADADERSKKWADERAEHAKQLVENVGLTSGALLRIAETTEKHADLVSKIGTAQPAPAAPPRPTGTEVVGQVALGFFDAIKTLGTVALQKNPNLAKALEGPLTKGAEIAKLGEQAAAEAGVGGPTPPASGPSDSKASAPVASEAVAPSEVLPTQPGAAATVPDLPLSALNNPEAIRALTAKFGPHFWETAKISDLIAFVSGRSQGQTDAR